MISKFACAILSAALGCSVLGLDASAEPLATLARYRRVARGVLFGQNLIHARPGQILVGDEVTVIRRQPPGARW